MEVAEVDPRDAQWELDAHRYLVYFWSPDGGFCTEYELNGAPAVGTVLAWASDQANGRVAEVFAYLVCDGSPGLVRLAGRRPSI